MERHNYADWEYVTEILVNMYGFSYSGIGDNAEECFYKRTGDIEERVFIHNLHCSYSMDLRIDYPSLNWERIREIKFSRYPLRIGGNSHRQSFYKLCNYLVEARKIVGVTVGGIHELSKNNPSHVFEGARSHLYDWAISLSGGTAEKLGKELFAISHFNDGKVYFFKEDILPLIKKYGIEVKWPV